MAAARAILTEAFRANPDSEQVWLAAVKLESENNNPVNARSLLAKARERAGTERVWMKSVLLERNLGENREALALLGTAIKAHPKYWKLLLMKAQIEQQLELFESLARDAAQSATREKKRADELQLPPFFGLAAIPPTTNTN